MVCISPVLNVPLTTPHYFIVKSAERTRRRLKDAKILLMKYIMSHAII